MKQGNGCNIATEKYHLYLVYRYLSEPDRVYRVKGLACSQSASKWVAHLVNVTVRQVSLKIRKQNLIRTPLKNSRMLELLISSVDPSQPLHHDIPNR